MIEYIPDEFKQHYDNIKNWPTIQEEVADSDLEAESSGDED